VDQAQLQPALLATLIAFSGNGRAQAQPVLD
ncbi:hypothetical protein K3Z99_21605, partial [Pseudomonas aeruginosa]|nr:hypothetical protein [Pseudomonas aeruginosa]